MGYTRSSNVKLKFANAGKQSLLCTFLKEYRRVVQIAVDRLWDLDSIPKFHPKNLIAKSETWLYAGIIQAASKQAVGIAKSARQKQDQRKYRVVRLTEEGHLQAAANLQAVIDRTTISKSKIGKIAAHLDSRFVNFGGENRNTFDWITLWYCRRAIPRKRSKKIVLPFKRHVHLNRLSAKGGLCKFVQISEKSITFCFNVEPPPNTGTTTLGIDVGISSVITTSVGTLSQPNHHGHNLLSIGKELSRRKKGSNGFHRAQAHRKNYIGWAVNRLNLDGVREVKRENIKNLRKCRETSRFMSHWTYSELFGKLDRYCEERGVLVNVVNPAYTSQTCSRCHARGSRRGKVFECSCGFISDSDINAAMNIATGEPLVPQEIVERLN